jgi:hypothetical protein
MAYAKNLIDHAHIDAFIDEAFRGNPAAVEVHIVHCPNSV